jgi:subtilisin family serine protease
MTLDDIAHQLVITVSGLALKARLERVLAELGAYSPELVTDWEIRDEKGDVLFSLQQFGVVPPREVIERVKAKHDVDIEPNMVMGQAAVPNDPLYQNAWPFHKPQWDLYQMNAQAAWDCAPGAGVPVIVAVIDSGIATLHPDLVGLVHPKSRRIMGATFNNLIEDDDGHGTFVAGTIAAITNNATGMASATWPITVRLLALKFYDPWNPLDAASAAKAIVWAVLQGAKIINASWHVGMPSTFLRICIQFAEFMDVLFVTSAGNEGTNNDDPYLPIYPASWTTTLSNIVSVMATNHNDDRPSFSNYGRTTVHIAAPGVRVLSTHYYLGSPVWRTYSGTSAAAAQVTAAAALIRALRPGWNAQKVRDRLMTTVDPFRFLDCIAGGRLNLGRAICHLPP